jgi:hypothetical protein
MVDCKEWDCPFSLVCLLGGAKKRVGSLIVARCTCCAVVFLLRALRVGSSCVCPVSTRPGSSCPAWDLLPSIVFSCPTCDGVLPDG